MDLRGAFEGSKANVERRRKRWLYVAAVLDLYSRRIVGWSMQESMTSPLVVGALMRAVWRRGKPLALLHRSDQGGQPTTIRSPASPWPSTNKKSPCTAGASDSLAVEVGRSEPLSATCTN